MKILVFSDIHGAVPAVEALAATEARDFDAVVIAGDIGPSTAKFFRALEPFRCPVLYVYGNWDHDLAYDHVFHERCKHLHGSAVPVGDLLFTGYSGCEMQWGLNPVWRNLLKDVEASHQPLMEKVAAAEAADRVQSAKIDDACDAESREITTKARDRRRRSYKMRLEAIERKRERLKMLKCRKVERVRESRAFRTYSVARSNAWREAASRNRTEVISRIQQSGHDPSRVILVTHERLYRLHEDCPGLGAHLFGHRHGFKVSKQHGTTFVNVSALDPWSLVHATYGVIMWERDSGYVVERRQLPRADELAARCMRYRDTEIGQSVPSE